MSAVDSVQVFFFNKKRVWVPNSFCFFKMVLLRSIQRFLFLKQHILNITWLIFLFGSLCGVRSQEIKRNNPDFSIELLESGNLNKLNVDVLTSDTLAELLNREPSSVVFFYLPGCYACKSLFPHYNEAAELLQSRNISIKLGIIDGLRSLELLEIYGISRFPSVKLFLDNNPFDLDLIGQNSLEIVDIIERRLQTIIRLDNWEQFMEFKLKHQQFPLLIGSFQQIDSGPNYQTFHQLSRTRDNIKFLSINDSTIKSNLIEYYHLPDTFYEKDDSIILWKPYGDYEIMRETPIAIYEDDINNITQLESFAKLYFNPTVIHFTGEKAPIIFSDNRPIWVLFSSTSHNSKDIEKAYTATNKLAQEFRGDIIFLYSSGTQVADTHLKNLLNVEINHIPTARLFNTNPNGHKMWYPTLKYKPTEELLTTWDHQGLVQFIDDFKKQKLKPFTKSEAIPDPELNPGPVFTLVSDEFDTLVYNSPHDILLEIYAPWCGHCRVLESTYLAVAKKLLPVNHVRVMKMDGTLNEVNLLISGYPTIILFVKKVNQDTSERKTPIYFYGERTIEGIIKWLAHHSSKPIDVEKVLRNKMTDEDLLKIKSKRNSNSSKGIPWTAEEL